MIGVTGSGANPFGDAGAYRDSESSFYYLRARYYDPSTQEFLSRDSLLTELPYAYVAGGPLNAVDPSGHFAWALAAFVDEIKYPGIRAKPGDVSDPSNWDGHPDRPPHIHVPGAGRGGHVPVAPGVLPR